TPTPGSWLCPDFRVYRPKHLGPTDAPTEAGVRSSLAAGVSQRWRRFLVRSREVASPAPAPRQALGGTAAPAPRGALLSASLEHGGAARRRHRLGAPPPHRQLLRGQRASWPLGG